MTTEPDTAFVLHTRPYRETSQLVTLFAHNHGRLTVLARGARRDKRGGGKLAPFNELQVAWRGRGSLKTLTLAETIANPVILGGRLLFVGLYLNELLMRLLHEHDPHAVLFNHYKALLQALATGTDPEPLLRCFELGLLDELGYGLQLHRDVITGEPVKATSRYCYISGEGVALAPELAGNGTQSAGVFSGGHLLAMHQGDYSDPAIRKTAKKLMRLALQPHLGSKPLRSRALFQGLDFEGE